MALYDGFFDAVQDEDTGEYDRAYSSGDFTGYYSNLIGSGVCIHDNPDSFKAEFEGEKLYLRMGYLFIKGYWLANVPGKDEDPDTFKGYEVTLPGTGTYAIVAHLNLGQRFIEIKADSVAQAYPDSLVLAIVSPTSAEDTRHNTDICGTIDTAGELSKKVEWAINYIDNEIEDKLAAAEQTIAAQELRLNAKIAEVQAVSDSIIPPPIGTIKFSASQNVGEEWLQCNGDFVSESQYPELVEALGKLTPSSDKFYLISSGEIGPQISNGAIYNGRFWVYSYSTKKLYGVDVSGSENINEITLMSEDAHFNDFLAPSTARPIALSVVPHKSGSGAEIFLSQIISNGGNVDENAGDGWKSRFLIFSSAFSGNETELQMETPFQKINSQQQGSYELYVSFNAAQCVPLVVSNIVNGAEKYYCAAGNGHGISWEKGGTEADIISILTEKTDSNFSKRQRVSYSHKNSGEAVFVNTQGYGQQYSYTIKSYQNGTFAFSSGAFNGPESKRQIEGPINIAGADAVLSAYEKNAITWLSTEYTHGKSVTISNLPSAARVFVDAAAYLWGKDIYMIFVGTGIIFSRTLEDGSFGYLDTTSVLGTITQFGYLDYSDDEGTLYLLGQDTTNTVKVAKIVLNTLYDYANDGAWLPMIASDGVPAYIKAYEPGAGT